MTRKTPPAPPPVQKKEKDGWVNQIRTYKVITPLYGGGEETQKPDSVTVVRATEVRGHLRFWWRATRGGNPNGDLAEMRLREGEIWGSSGGKDSTGKEKPGHSKVSMQVVDWGHDEPIKKAKDKKGKLVEIGEPGSTISYVAFPLRRQENVPPGEVLSGVHFELKIAYPQDLADDVEAAIWAWETFGGIGARTRRGLGAILCTQAVKVSEEVTSDITPQLPMSANVNQLLKADMKKFVIRGIWPGGVPHLSETTEFYTTSRMNNEELAWVGLFNALQDFRQKNARYDRKTGKRRESGMSRWPEANAIRNVFGLPPKFPLDAPNSVIKKYPRGVFGLPIGFEMHHDKKIKTRPELRGSHHDRLASPLILRPITCNDGAVGLAAILKWSPMRGDEPYSPPGGLILNDAPGNPKVSSKLEQVEADNIPPLDHEMDVLKAFLNYLRKSGGTKP